MSLDDLAPKIRRTSKISAETLPDYKIIEYRGGTKRFTEESWKNICSIVKKKFSVDLNTLRADRQIEMITKATKIAPLNYKCIICNNNFEFPNKWNFIRVNGMIFCRTHSIGEIYDYLGSNKKSVGSVGLLMDINGFK